MAGAFPPTAKAVGLYAQKFMTTAQLFQSFLAFNQNALNNLAFTIRSNLFIVFSIIGSLWIILMNVKDEISSFVDEQQTIL